MNSHVYLCPYRQLCKDYTEAYTEKLLAKSVSNELKAKLEVGWVHAYICM